MASTRLGANCTNTDASDFSMKDKNHEPAKLHTDNAKHQQEDTASHDYEKQRKAGAKEAEANAKKPKKTGK